MAGIATTMSWIFQVVDRGASARVAKFSSRMGGAQGQARSMGAAMRSASGDIRGYALQTASAGAMTFVLGSAIRQSLSAFSEFEKKITATKLVLSPTTKELARLKRQAMQLPGALEFAPTQIAETQRLFGQAGFGVQGVLRSTKLGADLATAGMIDLATATELNINLQRGFRVALSDAAKAQDKVVKLTQLTPLSIQETGDALGFATGAASAFNQSIDDTLILLGLLKPITKTASKAGTSLRSVGRALTRTQGRDILTQLGVSGIDAAGRTRPFLDILLDVDKAVQKLDKSQRQYTLSQLLGIRGMQAYTAVTNAQVKGSGDLADIILTGADAIEELRKRTEDSEGTTARFAKRMRETYSGSVSRFEAAWEALTVAVGEGFNPEIKKLSQLLTPMIQSLTSFMQAMDGWPAKILAYALAWKTAGMAIATTRNVVGAFRASAAAQFIGMGGAAAGGGGGGLGGVPVGRTAAERTANEQAAMDRAARRAHRRANRAAGAARGPTPFMVSPLTGRPTTVQGLGRDISTLESMGRGRTAQQAFLDARRKVGERNFPGLRDSIYTTQLRQGTPQVPRFADAGRRIRAERRIRSLTDMVPDIAMRERAAATARLQDRRRRRFGAGAVDERLFLRDSAARARLERRRGGIPAQRLTFEQTEAARQDATRRASRIARKRGIEADSPAFRRMQRQFFEEGRREAARATAAASMGDRLDAMSPSAERRHRVRRRQMRLRDASQRLTKSFKQMGTTGMGAFRNFGQAVGNTIGPIGAMLVAFEAVTFAVHRFKATVHELHSAQKMRLDELDNFRSKLSLINDFTDKIVSAPRGAGGIVKVLDEDLKRLLPEMYDIGIENEEVEDLVSKITPGMKKSEARKLVLGMLRSQKGLGSEAEDKKLTGIIKAQERLIKKQEIRESVDKLKDTRNFVQLMANEEGLKAKARAQAAQRLAGRAPEDEVAALQEFAEWASGAGTRAQIADTGRMFDELASGQIWEAFKSALQQATITMLPGLRGFSDVMDLWIAQALKHQVRGTFGEAARRTQERLGPQPAKIKVKVENDKEVFEVDLKHLNERIRMQAGHLMLEGDIAYVPGG